MENIVYGYITLNTLQQLGEEPYLDQLLINVKGNRYDERHIRDVAGAVSQALEQRGHPVLRVEVPPPGKHPHADIMGLLLLAMSAFGICVLALTGVLVVNLITGLMAAQIPHIGVMKALGASDNQIARIYLGQTAVIGVAAVIAGVIPGVVGGRILCNYMAIFLNFDITSMAVPLWVFLLVSVVGIAVPLIAAVFPISRACSVPVRVALADTGMTGTTFGESRLDRLLAGVSGLPRPVLLALRNGFRRRNRFLLTVATLAAGGVFFMSALNMRSSLINTLDVLFSGRKYDLSISLAGMQFLEKIDKAVTAVGGVARYEGWTTAEASVAGVGFIAVAIPPNSSLLSFRFIAGQGFIRDGRDQIIVNSALAARDPQFKPGALVPIQIGSENLNLTVTGIAREAFSPPVAYVIRSSPLVNSLRVGLTHADEASLDRARSALEASLARQGIRVVSSTSTAEGRTGFDLHMVMIYVFLIIVSCIVVGVGGLGLATSLSLNVLERRREMAILRCIGATPGRIYQLIVAEGIATGLLAWAVATFLAWPVSKSLSSILAAAMFKSGLDFQFEWRGILVWLAVSVALGAAASLLPAWHASRLTIREALARG